MKVKFLFLLVFFAFSLLVKTNAQPCATLNIQGPPSGTIPCDSALVLTANVVFPSGLNSTSTYAGSVVPFAPQPWMGANQIIANQDDVWSGLVALPFPFCFYGNVYNNMIVSSNGQIGFDAAQAGTGNAWATSGMVLPLNSVTFNNTIMSPHHDILPTSSTSYITWDIFGTAPCRKMVVNFTNIPMFSCTSIIDTQQIVLYELTNIIDINIKNKPLCATWNGGVAHEGIQNANGTVANMVPGRNGTQWTANDDAYRFTPNGAPMPVSFAYTWINLANNATLGTGQVLTLPAPVTITDVVCLVNVTGGCSPYSFSDTFHINVGKVSADFTPEIHLGCVNDTVKVINTTNPQVNTNYIWNWGDGTSLSYTTNPKHVYINQGIYTITLIANHFPCIPDTIQKVVDLRHPINSLYGTKGTDNKLDSVCLGLPLQVDGSISTPAPPNLIYFWNWGDGNSFNSGTSTINNYTYLQAGIYTLTLVVTDSLGCKDTSSHQIYVEPTPYANFTVSDSVLCVGQPVYFNDTISALALSWVWDYNDGSNASNVHDPMHTWASGGNYNTTLTVDYPVCPNVVVAKNISVDDYPQVNLGPDTSICPGLTNSILLYNQNSTTGLYQWSTNETSNAIIATNPGLYWVNVSSPNGECHTTDSIWVLRDCYLNIPNSFSPNGDGLNDYFLPRELLSSGLTKFNMSIFNRWGEEIFYTDKIDGRGWDGKYNGITQPMGVFVYLINAEFRNGVKKTFKGNVTLVK